MKKVLGFLLLLVIIALIIFLFIFKGFGGFGKDSGKGKGEDKSIPVTSEEVEKTTAEKAESTIVRDRRPEGAEITVSGHDYLFNNEKVSLDELVDEISKLDKDALITISSDDTAAKNTVDELTDKLDELGYKNYNKFIS